jgi:hypothetical protein
VVVAGVELVGAGSDFVELAADESAAWRQIETFRRLRGLWM